MKPIKILLIVLSFSIIGKSYAFKLGLKTGILSTKYNYKFYSYPGSNDPNDIIRLYKDSRIGPMISIFYKSQYKVGQVELETSYLQKGGIEKVQGVTISNPEGTGKYTKYDIQFDYLQFSCNIQPYLFSNFKFISGITVNYLLSVEGTPIAVEYNDFILGYSLGIGVEIENLFITPFIIEAFINNDITELHKTTSHIKYNKNMYAIRFGFYIL